MHARRSSLLLVFAAMVARTACAQEALPETETYISAAPIAKPAPDYPPFALAQGKEGWVIVSYVISPKGEVIEPMIEDSSGTHAFDRAALRAVEGWRFAPATRNGEPVEQAITATRVVFKLEGGTANRAAPEFIEKTQEIARALSEDRLQVAERLLTELEIDGRRNLYEDAAFWWLKFVYLDKTNSTDNDEKRRVLSRAAGYEEEYLPPRTFVSALGHLVVAETNLRDFSAAIATFERLRDSEWAQGADNYDRTVATLTPNYERMLGFVTGEDVLSLRGDIGEYGYWVHDLIRDAFSLAEIDGRIEMVDIRCAFGAKRFRTAPVDTVWRVPPEWGSCGIYVKGDQGTTFVFREHPLSYAVTESIDISLVEQTP